MCQIFASFSTNFFKCEVNSILLIYEVCRKSSDPQSYFYPMTKVGLGMFRSVNRSDSTSSNSADTRPLLEDTPATDHPPPSLADTMDSSANSSKDSTTINLQSVAGNSASNQSDFVFIKIVARITLQLVRKFWAFSSAAVLAIVLFYWLCGGIVAFAFVTFAVSGMITRT